jgi:hypothetical protein
MAMAAHLLMTMGKEPSHTCRAGGEGGVLVDVNAWEE